jgi:UDP-N-acetylglucosamine 1-carboxyvinyltransferase
MRASILILGPLLARFGEVKISLPGGCAIGTRPIDIHLEGLQKLGANFVVENGYVIGRVKEQLIGSHIPLPFPSVGATENIMMAATITKGKTIIENAALEPEISDLARSLNKMGAKIKIEKNGIIKIEGVKKLTKANHKIMSDRIVAGTFVIAAVMLNKNFEVQEVESCHLEALTSSLKEMGAKLKIKKNSIQIIPSKNLNGVKIQTAPYPGFPTDLQAQIMALMSISKGNSQIKENIFENRFMHVPELNRLGAQIKVKKDIAYISGNRKLKGAQVMASDLRASVSLVLAALCAEGKSVINRVYHLDRGYEKIENTLGKLGPSIKREKY